MKKKKLRIFVSVSDRKGVVKFLNNLGKIFSLEIIATHGTGKYLKEKGIIITLVEKITGFPVLFSGRIKSIHLPIFAGVLANKKNSEHLSQLRKYKIKPFDMVVINFYPFQMMVKEKKDLAEIIENIDIGGPALIRAAAKNFQSVISICDPKDYQRIIKDLKNKKNLSFKQRKNLAIKVFKLTKKFDSQVIKYLASF